MQGTNSLKTILSSILILFLLCTVIVAQVGYDKSSGSFEAQNFRFVVRAKTLLPPQVVKHLSFGFNTALADYYWISAIQDFTGWNYVDDFYINYFKNITTLDPKFSYPYLFAIFSVPNEKDPESLEKILPVATLGMETFKDNWEIPFYLGTAYNLYQKNTERTEHYLSIAVSKPSAPPLVSTVYSGFVTKKLIGRDGRIALMEVIRDTTKNETLKTLVAKGVLVEEISKMLEQGILAYKAKYKRYPRTIEELAKDNLIVNAQGVGTLFDVRINSQTGTFQLVEKK
jgi:hypothetical protein